MSIAQDLPTVATAQLTEQQKKQIPELIELMIEAKTKAYCPYSKFRVGCAILMKSGKKITGCNVENSSYGLSVCAERNAFTTAVSQGEKDFEIIVVGTDVEDHFISPCGACRQFMLEFGDSIVVLTKPSKEFKAYNLSSLIPLCFNPKDLEANRIN